MVLCVGLMSGTSLDGIDAAIVRVRDGRPEFAHGACLPFTGEFRRELVDLAHRDTIERESLVRMDALLGHLLADAVFQVVKEAGIGMNDITVIGSHGLTLGHFPLSRRRFGHETRFTMQIGDGDIIAVRTGRPVVSDFRRRDMAAGGEGAPLIPVLDALLFRTEAKNRGCLNIGGIANLTILPADPAQSVTAFDTGPGNCLLDLAVRRLVSDELTHDPGGRYASEGKVDRALLDRLLNDPYFHQPPPKSTGREYFSEAYLEHVLTIGRHLAFRDLLATIAALTVEAVVSAVTKWVLEPYRPHEILVSGGGVHNEYFMNYLNDRLPDCQVVSSSTVGIDPDFKEAIGFGWMAWRTINGVPSSMPSVTGARTAQILGKISPGS